MPEQATHAILASIDTTWGSDRTAHVPSVARGVVMMYLFCMSRAYRIYLTSTPENGARTALSQLDARAILPVYHCNHYTGG